MKQVYSPKALSSRMQMFSCQGTCSKLTDFLWMWWDCISDIKITEEIEAWYNSPFHALVSSYPLPGNNYHTHTHGSDKCYVSRIGCKHKMLEALSPALNLTPSHWTHAEQGEPIFSYYFSCVSCKIAHFICRTELLCLANWKGKVITLWIYRASSFVSIENGSNKAKEHSQQRCFHFNRQWQ